MDKNQKSVNARLARTKAKNDMALNLSELAAVTGYGYSSLKAMKLPLIYGKIRVSDFWKHMRYIRNLILAADVALGPIREAFSSPGEDHSTQVIADKFHAPRSSNDQPGASPSPAAHRARNIE
jgi:hypothetical protein